MDVIEVVVSPDQSVVVVQNPETPVQLTLETGTPGSDGVGVPPGGLTGQSLVKKSGTNYDTEWATVSGGTGGGVTDHGLLTGLTDDDHPQYLNSTRGDVRYYQKTEVNTMLAGKQDAGFYATTTDLDAKADASHTHNSSDVTDFDTEVSNNVDVAGNTAARHTHANKAVLDATTASFTTADETKLDGIAAGAEVNDVTSVAGKTGAVTLAKGDVGLANVDNTSDLAKPVSTATQTALNGKANTNHDHDARYLKVFVPEAYGAVGDGTTDDLSAIQAAVDAATAVGGGTVHLSEKAYAISGEINILSDNIEIRGVGNSSRIVSTHASANLITVGNGATKINFVAIENLRLECSVARTDGRGIMINLAGNVTIRDVLMHRQFHGVDVQGESNNIRIEGGYWTEFKAVDGIGVWIQGGNDHYIEGLVIDNPPGSEPMAGVRLQQTEGTWLSGCDFLHCRDGMKIDPQAGQFVSYIFATRVAMDFCSEYGLHINAATPTSLIQALNFTGCWTSSNMYDGIYMQGDPSATSGGLQFIGHRSFLNGRTGAKIDFGNDWTFDGCLISGNSAPARGTAIAAYHGIEVNNNSTGWAITNCRIGHIAAQGDVSQDRAIAVNGGDDYRITNNDLRGNVNAEGLYDGPTTTNKTIEGNVGSSAKPTHTHTPEQAGVFVISNGAANPAGATAGSIIIELKA